MCGIVGINGINGINGIIGTSAGGETAGLKARRPAHRGPDGVGVWCVPGAA